MPGPRTHSETRFSTLRSSPAGNPDAGGSVSGDAHAVRGRSGRSTVRGGQLSEDVRDVDARGLVADHEPFGDLAVGETLGEESEDFELARGEVELAERRVRCRSARRSGAKVDARAASECLDFGQQRPCAELGYDGVRVKEERFDC